VYHSAVTIRGVLYPFESVRSILADTSSISLTDEWRGIDISNLFQPTESVCGAYSPEPVLDCTIANPVNPTFPALESPAGQLCPSMQLLSTIRPVGRLFFTWPDIRNKRNNLFAFNGKVIDATTYISRTDPRNLTFTAPIASLIKGVIGGDSTRAFYESRESLKAIKCLQQDNFVGELGEETVGCVVNSTVLVFFIVVIFTVLLVK
jgi:hypothetical protein